MFPPGPGQRDPGMGLGLFLPSLNGAGQIFVLSFPTRMDIFFLFYSLIIS